jgi:putative beta-barrel porin BBP2
VNIPRPAGSGRRLRGAALACALTACAGTTAAGMQSVPPPADPDLFTEGMRRAGPFHLRPFVALKDVGYDDNITFEAQTPEGDATATLGGGFDAVLLTGERGGLRLFGEGDYVAFQQNTDLNHWNEAARARGIFMLKRASLSLEERYTSILDRPSTEIDQRVRHDNNALTAAVRTLGQGRLALKTFLRDEKIDYSSDDPSAGDVDALLSRNETTLSVIGEARLLPKTTFTLEGAVSSVVFDDASQARDSRKRALLPGVRFDPAAAVQGDLRAGPLELIALDRENSDFHGIVGDGHLTMRLGRAGRGKTGFGRNVEFSTLGNNLYYVGSLWTAAYEQFFSRRLSGELLYGRGLNHYPQEVPSGENAALLIVRDDHLTTSAVTVRYRANLQMTIEMRASHINRDSTDDFYDRTRNFYTFGTTYSF